MAFRFEDANITSERDLIDEIAQRAEKQWILENKLKEIIEKVQTLQIRLISYRDTNTYILQNSNYIS